MQARPGVASISVDNGRGGFLATQHLLEQGRQRIGLIAGPAGWWESSERRAGWRAALENAGRPPQPSQIVTSEWSVASGAAALQALLEQEPDLDAVFASSDPIDLGALHTLVRLGRRVPQDVALVGFGNIPEAAYFQPPLTTIHQPLAEIGRQAVQALQQLIDSRRQGVAPGQQAPIMADPTLIVRASSG